ncbi:hypothetical protein M1N59_02190, partial [Dehalococcoidales bacterium]|nr:hypothetical protein [Dehalococcoidales bacterium]
RPVQRLDIKGTLPKKNLSWQEAQPYLTIQRSRLNLKALTLPTLEKSYYFEHFKAGASIYPRCFWFVQPAVGKGLGVIDRAKPYLKTHPEVEKGAKEPWKGIEVAGEVEANFLYATLLGKHLLPFGYTKLDLVVLPIEVSEMGVRMLNSQTALRDGYSGLYHWLSQVEELWESRKKKGTAMNPYTRLDYRRLLISQHPTGYCNVLYGSAGTNIATCVVDTVTEYLLSENLSTHGFFAESETYLYQTKELKEAHYLCAFLNSGHVNQAVKPYQTKGAWGQRHIHRRPFEAVAIPKFNPEDEKHLKLAELSEKCHEKVAQLTLKGKSIGFLRNKVRQHLSTELDEIDKLVKGILSCDPDWFLHRGKV